MNVIEISTILFFFNLIFSLISAEENTKTTTGSSEVCELDNSCNQNETLLENQTEKTNVSEKWKYNISDGIITSNESNINIYPINETIGPTNLEIDASNASFNQSKFKNVTKSTNTKFQIRSSDRCLCDSDKGSCDLNCCCDLDCSNVNRDVFKVCNETQQMNEDSYCPSKILNSPFLCIVRDNLYSRHFYPQHQAPHELTNVEKLLKNRNIFSWPFSSLPTDTASDFELPKELKEYEIGSPVWILTNDSKLKQFSLPQSTLMSRDCKNTTPVKFLKNYESPCTHRIENISRSICEEENSVFNAARYFNNFSFIMNPNLTNLSIPLNCSRNCASIKPYICENEYQDLCNSYNATMKPIFSNNTCSRAVSSVHYNIIHNGSEGIMSVELYFQLGPVEFKTNILWAITFKLTYQWVNQAHYYSLSGYPGYIFGRPVISGNFVPKKGSKKNVTDYSIEMSYNRQHWLTYFQTNMKGECLKMHRSNVLFKENVFTHCFLKIPKISNVEQCDSFQNEIFRVMFGERTNITNVYLSSFGQPDIQDKTKWVPMSFNLFNNIMNESCNGIITAVRILILHALIGDHDNPQQSIVGVKVVGLAFDQNLQKYEKLKISVSVNFYDITNPPLRIFAEPPTYEVKLPTDFFYPFFSRSTKLLGPNCFVSGFILIFILKM